MTLRKRIAGSAGALVIGTALFCSLTAAPAQAYAPGAPSFQMKSTLTLDQPLGSTPEVSYRLSLSDFNTATSYVEGKSFFDTTFSPSLTFEGITVSGENWAASPGPTSTQLRLQGNDLNFHSSPEEPDYVVLHFAVNDSSVSASVTTTSEYHGETTTVTSEDAPLTLLTNTLPVGQFGQSYGATLASSRFTPVSYQATGLPDGLSMTSAGRISGQPKTAGTYPVQVTAHSRTGGPDAVMNYALVVKGIAPAITSGSPAAAVVGSPYSFAVTASGTAGLFAITSGRLPNGLSINKQTGVVSGNPTTPGTSRFTVTVSNSAGSAAMVSTIEVSSKVGDF